VIEQDLVEVYEALGMLSDEAEQTSSSATGRHAVALSKYMAGMSDAYSQAAKLLKCVLDKAGVKVVQEGKGEVRDHG